MTPSAIEAVLLRRERTVLTALCVLAAARIFVFSAAFPVFNNVDEKAHFDVVQKHAAGNLPTQCGPPYEKVSRDLVATYSSPEFLFAPADYPDRSIPPPLWKRPQPEASVLIGRASEFMRSFTNKESCSPPFYYAVAALWQRLGQSLGASGGIAIYWLRFLNVPNMIALVLLAYAFTRRFFANDPFLRLSAPALVAFVPQDAFYSINGDVLSALVFGLALYLLIRILREETGYGTRVLAGLLVSAALLTKISNWVLAPLAAAMALRPLVRTLKRGPSGATTSEVLKTAAFAAAAALPVVAWVVRNNRIAGDPFAIEEKTRGLGWTVKPLLDRFDNPIFTPAGCADFLAGTLRTFWRGEFVWHREDLAIGAMDAVYVGTSAVFLLAWGLAWLRGRRAGRNDTHQPKTIDARRTAEVVCALSIGLFVVFFVWASVRYDYGTCPYPSRDRPYLRSGRLMLGALIPFVVVYLSGLRVLLSRVRIAAAPFVLVLALIAAMTATEIALTAPVLASAYNWFHLP